MHDMQVAQSAWHSIIAIFGSVMCHRRAMSLAQPSTCDLQVQDLSCHTGCGQLVSASHLTRGRGRMSIRVGIQYLLRLLRLLAREALIYSIMLRLLLWPLRAQDQRLLLPNDRPSSDVQLTPVVGGMPGTTHPRVKVVRPRWSERALAMSLFLTLVVPTTTITVVVWNAWQNEPSQGGWLILGLGFYILTALRAVWKLFVEVCERILYLCVEVRRYVSPTLFETVADALAKDSERQGLTCSWDGEATQEHDSVTGDKAIRMRFWSSQPRTLRVYVAMPVDEQQSGVVERMVDLLVTFCPGDEIVCGRDSRVERREVMVLWMRISAESVLRDKALLMQWLDECRQGYTEPLEEIVNVYALQGSSTAWMPEWKVEQGKSCKTSSGLGQCFFLERPSLNKVLADAKLWSDSALQVFLITGLPGVGKSPFTFWLAGEL